VVNEDVCEGPPAQSIKRIIIVLVSFHPFPTDIDKKNRDMSSNILKNIKGLLMNTSRPISFTLFKSSFAISRAIVTQPDSMLKIEQK